MIQYVCGWTLTKYFLAYVVAEIIKSDPDGKLLFNNFDKVIKDGKLSDFSTMFKDLASTTVDDINAEIVDLEDFDYKRDLKSIRWCRSVGSKVKATYNKDVKRKKATSVAELVRPLLND